MTVSKQDIKVLRAISQQLSPSMWIGKQGITPAVLEQLNEALDSRELVKCVIQETCPNDVKDVASETADNLRATVIQIIGRRFVLYRYSKKEHGKHVSLSR